MRRWQGWATCVGLLLSAGATLAGNFRVGIGDTCPNPTPQGVCFTPSELTLSVGDSVQFFQNAESNFTGAHNVVADDGSFRCARGCDGEGGDGTPASDSTCTPWGYCVWSPDRIDFTRTFAVPGFVRYHDEVSGAAGAIHVLARPTDYLSISELYSNADGSSQFVVLWASPGASLAGVELVSSAGSRRTTLVLPTSIASTSAGTVLLATRAFADRHALAPDAILPDGFLFAPDGTLGMSNGANSLAYRSLPTDGRLALYPRVDYDIGSVDFRAAPAVAVNLAGDFVALAPFDVTHVVEYRHAALDEFFLTAFPDEIAALDTGRIAGWQRTGLTLPTWSGAPVDALLIPRLRPVCRVFLGTSHFFSVNGCADAMAVPGARLESGTAFHAMPPDHADGRCPSGQVSVYQLWNPRGTTHRYTMHSEVRQQMLAAGFVAEGYGEMGVTMCVPAAASLPAPGDR